MSIKTINVSDLPRKYDAADLTSDEVVDRYNAVNASSDSVFAKKFATKESVLNSLTTHNLEISKTYFKSLDEAVKFPSSGVVVITGRPGHGKSSLMRNIALRKALNGEKVVYITYEFSQYEEVLNFAQTLHGDPPNRNDVLAGKNESFEEISSLLRSNLFITHEIKQIEEIQALLKSEEFADSVTFIDYIQKVPSAAFSGDSTGSEGHIRHVCNILNDIAISNNVLIITGSQLTQSKDGAPTQDVVKGAKAIEEVASVLLRIWRHNVSEASALHDLLFKKDNADFVIDVRKNRRGQSNIRIGLNTYKGITLLDKEEKINHGSI